MSKMLTAFDRWLPKPEVKASVPEPKPVTARLDITEADLCPYCGDRMRRTTALGIDVFLCDHDRHVAPVPNDNI